MHLITIGLLVRFAQGTYNGSEEDGYVSVSVELVGGTADASFEIMILPSEQSPVSAEGMQCTTSIFQNSNFPFSVNAL